MTIPSVVAADTTTTSQAANSNTIVISTPSNVVNDDIVAFIVGNDAVNPVTNGYTTAVSGLTTLRLNLDDAIDAEIGVWYRRVDGSEASTYTFTLRNSALSQHFGWGIRVTDVDTTTAIDVTGSNQADGTVSSAAPATVSAITTVSDDCLAVSVLSFDGGDGDPFTGGGTGWPTTLSGSDGGTLAGGTGGANASGCWAAKDIASTGTTEDCTLAPAGVAGTDGAVFFMFAFRGVSGAPPAGANLLTLLGVG